MKFSYNWLQSLVEQKLPTPVLLAEVLTMRAFEVEEIKKMGQDWVMDIKVLPNRAGDCLSHFGIAREISAILSQKFQESKIELKEDGQLKSQEIISVQVSDSNDCPRYLAKAIVDCQVAPSPKWLKERINVCGIQSINNLVDIANYVMLEMGQPLHIFDLDKISDKIIVRRAKKNEKIRTLDEKDYLLTEEVLVIADQEKLLGIAGIKGGVGAEVSNQTKRIIIESASFNRQVIRKGSARLGIRTDASLRFEHGFDNNLNKLAINRATALIQKIAGGKIARGEVDICSQKNISKTILLDLGQAESILGMKITKGVEILTSLGFKIKSKNREKIRVAVPTRRIDIVLPEDLVEEVGRLTGYEKIISEMPRLEKVIPQRSITLFWEDKIKEILKSAGFSEVFNYSFISQEQSEHFNYPDSKLIEIESPVTKEQRYLRPSLAPHLFKNLKRNEKFFDNVKIFELGKVFPKEAKERRQLAALMTGDSFFHLKGILELIFQELGLKKSKYLSGGNQLFLDDIKKSRLLINSKEIGYLGMANPNLLRELKIEKSFSIFEINFDELIKAASEKKEYQPLARFPETTRDLSILLPARISFQEILAKIKKHQPKLLKEIRFFDFYQGKNLPEGKKSISLRFSYQGKRTLTAIEVNQWQEKLIQEIEKEKEWQVRKLQNRNSLK